MSIVERRPELGTPRVCDELTIHDESLVGEALFSYIKNAESPHSFPVMPFDAHRSSEAMCTDTQCIESIIGRLGNEYSKLVTVVFGAGEPAADEDESLLYARVRLRED